MVAEQTRISTRLTPRGQVRLVQDPEAAALPEASRQRIEQAFSVGSGHGLLDLGIREVGTVLPPAFDFWRRLASKFIAAVCSIPDLEDSKAGWSVASPSVTELSFFAFTAPPMMGGEYISAEVLAGLWQDLETAFRTELAESNTGIQEFLRQRNPAWNLVGRVHFHLAENRKDPDAPFAFLATYTTRLSSTAKAQHLPLGQALKEYSSAKDRGRLLSLLLPVQRAAGTCSWLKSMVDRKEIFRPVRWQPGQALTFLADIPLLENAGIVVRIPQGWPGGRPARAQVRATVGAGGPKQSVTGALLDFNVDVVLDGEPLTPAEIRELLAGTEGLSMIRGRWVEVDPQRLIHILEMFGKARETARQEGLSFSDAMRLLSGASALGSIEADEEHSQWSQVVAGPWLQETLERLRHPDHARVPDPGDGFRAVLRPYQTQGVSWLYLLSQLGLGACLADDMGLGKTLQVLALLMVLRRAHPDAHKPSLLVAPATLMANWSAEIEKFTPDLSMRIAHPSSTDLAGLKEDKPPDLEGVDLVITSYGSLLRMPWLKEVPWRLLILDEAQAIKNPGAKQTQAAKKIRADARIVMTGTPVENRLMDLWSLFDFTHPGLLGNTVEFGQYVKARSKVVDNPYGPLRKLVSPYILRRLKTDRSVISDLPDKTEVTAYCHLTRRQAALYSASVADLTKQLEEVEGINRRGLILAYLMRFKQICNHPSQWLGDGSYEQDDSGKWARIRDITEVLASRQEKALVFTQFREIIAPLAAFLGQLFGRPGLVLHGETPVKKRRELVSSFQDDDDIPFMILSLKAGGSGLNLTAASHVIHFDRWWNPAVENQATDRAFRIGQKNNVLVHKFVCRGTIEERIDALIESKKELAEELLGTSSELVLTEMSNADLLNLVSLDLNKALKE
jgi:non-specific serine/threonine protein kinase